MMHGKLPCNLHEKLAVKQPYQWLKSGDIKGEIESKMVAAQDQVVPFHSIQGTTAPFGPRPPQNTLQFCSVFCLFSPFLY